MEDAIRLDARVCIDVTLRPIFEAQYPDASWHTLEYPSPWTPDFMAPMYADNGCDCIVWSSTRRFSWSQSLYWNTL